MHGYASSIIFFAVVVSLMDVAGMEDREFYMQYALLFMLCTVFQVISHSIKE
jgi:hypothetical protein